MATATKRRVRKAKKKARNLSDSGNERIVTQLGEVDFASRTISNSGRGTFLDCAQKWLLDYGYRLRRRGLKDYFWVGGVAHDEWERMYLQGKFDKRAANRRINKKTKAAALKCVTSDQEDKIWKASAMLMGMLPAYAEHYLAQDLKHHKIIVAEEGFEIRIPGTDWTYVGFTDILSTVKKSHGEMTKGELVLWENKTSGVLDVNYIAKLPLDFQILGYCWGVQQERGMTPDWVMYNVSLKTRLRQKQDETKGQYLDRVEADYQEDPVKYFYREPLVFPDDAIERFVDELTQWVIYDLEPALQVGYFPKNTRQCTMRGLCDYMPICCGAIDLDEALLQFERKELSPRELREQNND